MKTIEPQFEHHAPFGDSLTLDMPADCDVVVLCTADLGLHPVRVLLPHQIYLADLRELAAIHGVREFAVLPYKSAAVMLFKLPPSGDSNAGR